MGRRSALVGRDAELRAIENLLTIARSGNGGALFLVGEGGIGKSRLTATAADQAFAADMVLLRGRGSAIGPAVPFRSLTEALLSLSRGGYQVDFAALGPYRHVLARLIPDWGPPPPGQDGVSLVILAEAVLRLTGLAGQDRGCLVVMDDLQDADAETLAVIEYLIDNLDPQSTVFLGAIRDEPCPARELARSAVQRGLANMIELGRLDRNQLRQLAGSRLGADPDDVPEPAVDLLWAGSAGNPFVIEELLNGIVDSGLIMRGSGGWQLAEQRQADVPVTLARCVATRVDALGPQARDLLSVAALLGRRFPLAVLQAVTELTDREMLSHLHGDLAAQFVTPDEQLADWYGFQHQLIREAVLTRLTPAERARLATQAADALDTVYPGLPGEWCQVAATLRLESGDSAGAGQLFAEAGRRAQAEGAANSAVALLDKAWDLMAHDDASARAATLENLLYALVDAGLVERALASVGTLDQLAGGLDRRRRAQLHTKLAWAATIAGQPALGQAQITAARTLLGPDATAEDMARVDTVAAHLALDTSGPHQLQTAESLARRAATVAEAAPLPVVACQALQLLGAVTRPRDPDGAAACLERARSIAVEHDLPIWEIHALVRLGNYDAMRDGTLDRLEQARRQASAAGAVTAQYQAESSIALHTVLHGDFAAADTLITEVLAAATRLKLLDTAQYVLLARAVSYGHRGRRQDMDSTLAEFRRWGGDQTLHAPRVYGLARTFCALLEENRPRALVELSHALDAERTNPTFFGLSGRYGLHLLLSTLCGDADLSTYRALTADPASGLRWDRQFALFAKSVLAGRSGQAAEATEAVSEALTVGAPYAMAKHLGLRLVCEAAVADGWGTPIEWLRMAEDHFYNANVPAVASACRALLRRVGLRVPQRRSGAEDIPAPLRSAGLTVREYEVLRLLAGRLANREIADRLHLSPRTVERHVSSLITKTGLPNRIALGELAATMTR